MLEELCPTLPGLVEDCSSGACRALFYSPWHAREAVREVLKQQREQGSLREDVVVGFVAHSWGGASILTELGQDDTGEPRLPVSWQQVDRVVLLDAYAPGLDGTVVVPEGVDVLWSYRHSIPNDEDCSSYVPSGPFVGLPPACPDSVACIDYDFHQSLRGGKPGHCLLVEEVWPWVLSNIRQGDRDGPPGDPVQTPSGAW